jgi:hypothetical protein
MERFSLMEALQNLYLDPFPTKKYRALVKVLKNVSLVIEELNELRMCCIDDILDKLAVTPVEADDNFKNRFISTTDVRKFLSDMQLPSRTNSLLVKMFRYLIIKLNRCTSEDAASILHDFHELRASIFRLRRHSTWDNSRTDEIVMTFVNKLIKMVRELSVDNCDTKVCLWGNKNVLRLILVHFQFHLFNIMRVMVTEFGKYSIYAPKIVKQLNGELKKYYEQLEALPPGSTINEYTLENYLTYLFILNDVIGRNFVNNIGEGGKEILADLRNVLSDAYQNKTMCSRESYIIQNILRIIEVYLTA